jgi:hypothetical protein
VESLFGMAGKNPHLPSSGNRLLKQFATFDSVGDLKEIIKKDK